MIACVVLFDDSTIDLTNLIISLFHAAMELALSLEKLTNEKLLKLHSVRILGHFYIDTSESFD